MTNAVEKLAIKEFFKAIDGAIGLSSEGVFVSLMADDLLWGYRDSLLHTIMEAQDIANKVLPKSKQLHLINTDLFGFGVSLT